MINELSMLFCYRGQSNWDECHVVASGRYHGSFLGMMMILMFLSKYEHRFLKMSVEIKKGGYITQS